MFGIDAAVGAGLGWAANQSLMQDQHYYNLSEIDYAANVNSKANEKAADNADARARKFYFDINSPAAVRKQLEDAGLSIGLMYGGAGGSGQGHASTQGAQGQGGGNQQGKTVTPNPGLISDLALAASEVKKNEAEANKLNAEADYTSGAKTENTEADTATLKVQVDQIVAETQSEYAKKRLLELQGNYQEIENMEAGTTLGWKIEKALYDLQQARETLTSTRWENYITSNAADTLIEQYNANLAKTYAEKLYYKTAAGVNKSQSALNFAEARNAIKLFGQQLKLQENKLNTDKYINSQNNATWENVAEKQANALMISAGISASPKLIDVAKDVLLQYGKKRVPIGFGRGK